MGDTGDRSQPLPGAPGASRRQFLTVLAGVAGTTLLSACGSQSPAPPASTGNQPSAPAPAASPAVVPTNVPSAPAPAPSPAAAASPAASPAPAAAAGAKTPQPGGRLTYGLSTTLDTLDPQGTDADAVIRITLHVCEPLLWEPEAGKFVPALAEKWDISSDGKVYTFSLKKGVKFHDGTPLNAEAVKFTFDRVVDPDFKAGQAHDQLGPYDHAEVVDDSTVKIVMKQPFAPLLDGLNGYMGIVSPTAVKSMGVAEFGRKPIGAGPFMVKEYVENDHVTLVKNPDYGWASSFFKHNGPAYLDEMVFKLILESAARTATLKTGETNFIESVDPLAYDDLKQDPKIVLIEKLQPGSGWTILINWEHGFAKDPAVRQAIEYGFDKEGFNKAVFRGLDVVASSPLSSPSFGYDPTTKSMYPYDPKKAAQILDEAGYKLNPATGIREKDGEPLKLIHIGIARPRDEKMASFVQATLRDIGIDVEVQLIPRPSFTETRLKKQYDMGFMWFTAGDPDVLRYMFHSKNINAFNRGQYKVPEVDKLLDDAAAATDPKERERLYAQIQQRVLKDAVVVPLLDDKTINAKRVEVQGDFLDFLASYTWFYDAWIER